MKHWLISIILVAPSAAFADKAIDCAKQPETTINDPGGTYTFTGACKKITVNGASNKLKIESVAKLSVTGAKNTLDVGTAETIDVSGAMNTLSYKAAKIHATGMGNKITQTK